MKLTPCLVIITLVALQSIGSVGNCQQRQRVGNSKGSVSLVIDSVSNYSVELFGIATANRADKKSEIAEAKNQLTKDLTGKLISFVAIVESVDASSNGWKLNIYRSELPIGENQRKQTLTFTGKPKRAIQELRKGDVVHISCSVNKSTSKSLASMEIDLRASSFVSSKPQRDVVKAFSSSNMLSDDRILFPVYVTEVKPITSPDESAKATELIMQIDKNRIEREKAR